MPDDFDPNDAPLEGEYIELPDDDDVEDTADGGAIVRMDDTPRRGDSAFYANLCEVISDQAQGAIATDLLDLISKDKEARKKRDEQYTEGLRRTGLGDDAPGGADFQGASRVVHPMLTEVCVDFSSRAIKELWPANGPAKAKIVGDATQERVSKASRKTDLLNWQLTVKVKEARSEFEQLLTQLPLGGGQYVKLTWNDKRNAPDFLFVAIDDIYLPFSASNFYTAQRKTHVQYLTRIEYEKRVKNGMYRDANLTVVSMEPEYSSASVANDKIEGRSETGYNEDGLRTVFEVYATWDIEEDDETDGAAPYVISIDKDSNKVLAIYRNWDEEDETQEELDWIVEFPFVPWRGAYPIGMIHMIGGISAAATGSLRALLDSAHIQNSATMLKLKGGTRGGQSLNIQPTEVAEIEGGLNVDDIRKLAMPLPFSGPSATLLSLLGILSDMGKGVVQTTLKETADSTENTPVGTTLARIEQGTVVFGAIHGRCHNAMQRLLTIQHRLNGMYLDDARLKKEVGSLLASRADFEGPMDVVPVSDPNIFSEAQRFAQMQAVAQRAQLRPDLYNPREVEERILATLKIPHPEGLLNPKMTPSQENAVAENVKATLGHPIVAFPDQDHIAHLTTHLPYMQSPMFGGSQLIAPSLLPMMLNHIKEHIALWYAQEVMATASEVTDQPLSEMIGNTKDKESRQALDRLISASSMDVVEAAPEVFGDMSKVIEQTIKLVQQLTPPMPQDPAVQVAMEDVKMRGKANEDKAEIEKTKLQVAEQERLAEQQADQQRIAAEAQADAQRIAAEQQADAQRIAAEQQVEQQANDQRIAAELQREREREAAETERTEMETETRRFMNSEDNRTALEIAEMGDGGGTDPNPTP